MKLNVPLPGEDDGIDLTPMIDCVFQLILFFMLTSTFIEESQAFKITLPKADEATTLSTGDVDSISVTKDGEYFWRQGESVPKSITGMDELLTKLKERGKGKDRPVIIRADAVCEYQRIIQVKNALKLGGVQTIFEEVSVQAKK